MQTEIVISGFGGQGVLFAGQVLAHAAMREQKKVTWFPSYGPEMRGGSASCTVIIADEEIGSPLVRSPMAVLAMNLPSLDKYEPVIRPEGVMVVNESMINRAVTRADLSVCRIPASEIAEELGQKRIANMVMLGGLLALLPVLPLESVEKALENHLPARHKKMLPTNIEALHRGATYAEPVPLDTA